MRAQGLESPEPEPGENPKAAKALHRQALVARLAHRQAVEEAKLEALREGAMPREAAQLAEEIVATSSGSGSGSGSEAEGAGSRPASGRSGLSTPSTAALMARALRMQEQVERMGTGSFSRTRSGTGASTPLSSRSYSAGRTLGSAPSTAGSGDGRGSGEAPGSRGWAAPARSKVPTAAGPRGKTSHTHRSHRKAPGKSARGPGPPPQTPGYVADLREQVQSLQELMELQSFKGGQANPLDLEIYKGDAAMRQAALAHQREMMQMQFELEKFERQVQLEELKQRISVLKGEARPAAALDEEDEDEDDAGDLLEEEPAAPADPFQVSVGGRWRGSEEGEARGAPGPPRPPTSSSDPDRSPAPEGAVARGSLTPPTASTMEVVIPVSVPSTDCSGPSRGSAPASSAPSSLARMKSRMFFVDPTTPMPRSRLARIARSNIAPGTSKWALM